LPIYSLEYCDCIIKICYFNNYGMNKYLEKSCVRVSKKECISLYVHIYNQFFKEWQVIMVGLIGL